MMIRQPIGRGWKIFLGILSVSLLTGVYAFLAHRQHQINPRDQTIPTIRMLAEGVAKACSPNGLSGEIWLLEDAKASYTRLFCGLLAGVLASVIIGVAMGCYEQIEAFFRPPLSFLAKIPPTAMLAVFFVMVGTGTEMFITMIAFGVLPTMAQAIHHAIKTEVPEELIFKARTLGASQPEIIFEVVFKQILPSLMEGIRLQLGPAMVYLIAAEMLVADVGFGYRIRLQSRLLDMRVVYVYLVFLGATGYCMDYALCRFRQKICPWDGK